jgi:tetratricopeptide (TPR) repeat protein
MARAAVKAKAKQGKPAAKPARGAVRSRQGRRRHASGGNPNQQLFFMRLRRRAKFVYVILAVLFALTFAFLGVGSGSSGGGLDQLFSGLNIFSSGGTSVSKAQSYIKKHPTDPKGFRDLATAYESKGDTANAIGALQQYTTIKKKDVKAWNELAGLQATQAQDYLQQYQAAFANSQLAAPSQSFLPTGKLGTALGTNRVEQIASQRASSSLSDLQSRTQLAFNSALDSFKQVTKIQPSNSNAWFQLGSAAQSAGNPTEAVRAYKRYLKLNPNSSSRGQIEQLIQQLSPAPAPAPKKKK